MTHGRLKITRHHVVEDIGELQPESFDVDEYCQTHPKSVLDTWDEKCSSLICAKCKLGGHAEHKTVDFDEAVAIARKEVADLAKEAHSSVTQQGIHLATIDTDLQVSDETCDNLTENISHTFNTMKTLIDQREKELQIELKQHTEKFRRELNEKKNTSEVSQKKCQTTSEYISKTLQYSSRHDIMSLRHILQSKTEKSISFAEAIVHESPPLTRFSTDGLERIKAVLVRFGQLTWTDDLTVAGQKSGCMSQTEGWLSAEYEDLKQELVQLQMSHEKEIQCLRENLTRKKEEEKRGLYILTTDVSDAAYLLNCTPVEFSRTKYNAEYVHINTEGELINKSQTSHPHSTQRLKKYAGTSSTTPLPQCGSAHYFEVRTILEGDRTVPGQALSLEIGVSREEEQDQSHWLGGCLHSYSLTVQHCLTHKSICRKVRRHGKHLLCQPDTLENTPGTSDTLHYGVVYDSVGHRIAFLDLNNEKIIGKIDNVDTSVDLWPMFGVYNPRFANVRMSLVVGRDIDMADSKKAMVLESLS